MNKKILIGVLCVVLISVCVFIGRYLYTINRYKKMISEIVISDVDLLKVEDGIYKGSCDAIMVAADVSVTVADHKITNIHIEQHKNDRGQDAEKITDLVMTAQSLEVDTISGATNSSKVILKAIENAMG